MSRFTPVALAFALFTAGCSGSDRSGIDPYAASSDDDIVDADLVADAAADGDEKLGDAGSGDADTSTEDASADDAALGTPDASDAGEAGIDAGTDAGPVATPLVIANLTATPAGAKSIALAWTAPASPPGGSVASYELRYSKTTITNDVDFAAATSASVPSPKAPGTLESLVVHGLDPDTTYYFAIRSTDGAGTSGPLSNVVSAKTKARASVLLSEFFFSLPARLELVATTAGNLEGVVLTHSQLPTPFHTFADVDVAVGEYVMVEAADFPSSGFMDNLISVIDGTSVIDAVAYSNRDGAVDAAPMSAFATAKANGSWAFTQNPLPATNECATQRDAVATIFDRETACGSGYSQLNASGYSLNRIESIDTNSLRDWYFAPSTPGASNSPIPAPAWNLSALSGPTESAIELYFTQEIDETTVTPSAFVASGLTITSAVLKAPMTVRLTTSTFNGLHTLGIVGLKTIYGTSVSGSRTFCGGTGMVRLSEVIPTMPGSSAVSNGRIELVATKAGHVGNIDVEVNPKSTGPFLYRVAKIEGVCPALGDTIVIHLDPYDATTPAKVESLAKDQFPNASYGAFYDGAWDLQIYQTNPQKGLPEADGVVALRRASTFNGYIDALAYTNGDGDLSASADFIASLQFMQSLGMWLPADCGGAACSGSTTPTAEGVAASLTGIGSSASGNSLRKTNIGDPSTAASWSVGPSSWGQAN